MFWGWYLFSIWKKILIERILQTSILLYLQYSCSTKTITCFVIFKIAKSVLFVSWIGERSLLTSGSQINKLGFCALLKVAKKLHSKVSKFLFSIWTQTTISLYKTESDYFKTCTWNSRMYSIGSCWECQFPKFLQSPFKHSIKNMNESNVVVNKLNAEKQRQRKDYYMR